MNGKSVSLLALLLLLPAMAAGQDAERLYSEACNEGDMIACNVFGLMLEQGDGIPQDLERAASLYERACEGGAYVGCTNLGILFDTGAGVVASAERAEGLYRVACEGGELLACNLLAPDAQVRGAASVERYSKVGRVGDEDSGNPLVDAIIELPDLGVRVISDRTGLLQLPGLPPGRHEITAERAGYQAVAGQLEVPGNPEFRLLMNRIPGDPLAPGRVEGQITDEAEEGISDVDVTLVGGEGVRTLSNQDGRFVLRNIPPGLVEVRFQRLGYAPRTARLIVHPSRTSDLSATMFARPIELAAIEVTVRNAFLEQSGFYRRVQGGRGTHFTPQELEQIGPIEMSQLVPRVPGVRLVEDENGAHAVSRRRQGFGPDTCIMPVYFDGVQSFDADLNRLQVEQIAAVEIYNGIETPIQYISSRNACGVVLIWTKR